MPGKVNPTQQEAMIMICTQVIGEDTAVAFAGAQGNFELNTMRPMVIRNVLHCARILGDACVQFKQYGVEGITLDRDQIAKNVDNSLMLVTALSPLVGYENAAKIAHNALEQKISLREAAVGGGFITAEEFDRAIDPRKMVGDPRRDLGMR
jgi:fumarate hydratase class II